MGATKAREDLLEVRELRITKIVKFLGTVLNFTSNGWFSFPNVVLAAAGANAATATVLSGQVNLITGADGAKGVALPAAADELAILVVNTSLTANLLVYPLSGGDDNINGLAEDLPFTMGPGKAAWFNATDGAQWYVGDQAGVLATTGEINRNTDVSTRQVAAGALLSLTEALHDGKTIALDTAAGSVVTLPAPVIGMRVRFLVTVKPTSNFHQVKVAAATDFLAGSANILDNDAAAQGAFIADGTADDNIQLNGTTKGGQVGDIIEIEGITATQWAIRAQLVCPAGSNPADMFSAAV